MFSNCWVMNQPCFFASASAAATMPVARRGAGVSTTLAPRNRISRRRSTEKDSANRRLDYYVSGYGTGGTITGAGQMIRLARPEVKIISTEPAGAALLEGKEWQPHKIQGWTPDFIPDVLDRKVAHRNIPVTDEESIQCSRDLATKEGIFCGISSGGTFAAALKVAQESEKGSVILAMLPDTGERYLSTPLFADIPDGPDEAQELLEGLDY